MNGISLRVIQRGFFRIFAATFLLGMGVIACQNDDANDRQRVGPVDAAPSSFPRVDAAIAGDSGVGSNTRVDTFPAADAGRAVPEDASRVVPEDARVGVLADSAMDVPTILEVGPIVDSGKLDAARSDGASASDTGQDGGRTADGSSVLVDGSVDSSPKPDLSPACQSLLIDNVGPPKDYPVLYREEANAQQTFEAEKARLLSTFSLTADDYQITTAPITWAARIQKFGGGQIPVTGPVNVNTTPALATSLVSDWAVLFKTKGVLTTNNTPTCANKFCWLVLYQDYCGMAVASDDYAYNGIMPVKFYATIAQSVSEVDSHFVPMIPMPRNLVLTDGEIRQAVVGHVFSFSCATSTRSATVTSQDQVTVPSGRTIYVRKSATVASALEYRLVIPTLVEIGGLSWTTYVDGIDGTVVAHEAHFVCN